MSSFESRGALLADAIMHSLLALWIVSWGGLGFSGLLVHGAGGDGKALALAGGIILAAGVALVLFAGAIYVLLVLVSKWARAVESWRRSE